MGKDIIKLISEREDLDAETAVKVLDRLDFLSGLHARNSDDYSMQIMERTQTIGTLTSYLSLNGDLTPEEKEKARKEILQLSAEIEQISRKKNGDNQSFEDYLEDSKLIAVNGALRYAENRVLVVDDEEPNREVFSHYLARKGFLVDLAENGSEGLEKAVMNNYAVIVSDYSMPHMNGLEMAREIKERVLRGEMLAPRIIYASGENISEKLAEVTPFAFVKKPVIINELGDLVSDAYQEAVTTQTE